MRAIKDVVLFGSVAVASAFGTLSCSKYVDDAITEHAKRVNAATVQNNAVSSDSLQSILDEELVHLELTDVSVRLVFHPDQELNDAGARAYIVRMEDGSYTMHLGSHGRTRGVIAHELIHIYARERPVGALALLPSIEELVASWYGRLRSDDRAQ